MFWMSSPASAVTISFGNCTPKSVAAELKNLHVLKQTVRLGSFYTWERWTADMVNHCRVLKQALHRPFSADLHLPWKLIFFFLFRPLSLPSCLGLHAGVEQQAGYFRLQRCSKCGVIRIGAHGRDSFTGSQRAGHWEEAITLLYSTWHICKSALCLLRFTICGKRLVASLLFTFSQFPRPHTPSPTICPCRTHRLSLYIWPCCSFCVWRCDCHGYRDLLWRWQRVKAIGRR